MKKMISLILALVMVLALTACGDDTTPTDGSVSDAINNGSHTIEQGNDNENPDETPEETEALASESPSFTFGSTTIAMNVDTATFIDALGEPKSYTEEESCAFEGLSKTYYFGSFYLETYPDGDTDRVYSVWLVDDSVSTEEGIYIGAPQQQVEKAYGAEWFNGKNAYIVKSAECILTVILDNGVVNSIQYTAVVQ